MDPIPKNDNKFRVTKEEVGSCGHLERFIGKVV
jgi:hypothetical protein